MNVTGVSRDTNLTDFFGFAGPGYLVAFFFAVLTAACVVAFFWKIGGNPGRVLFALLAVVFLFLTLFSLGVAFINQTQAGQ